MIERFKTEIRLIVVAARLLCSLKIIWLDGGIGRRDSLRKWRVGVGNRLKFMMSKPM
jgi:hypothetical protein